MGQSPPGEAEIAGRMAEAREVNDGLRALFLPQHGRRPWASRRWGFIRGSSRRWRLMVIRWRCEGAEPAAFCVPTLHLLALECGLLAAGKHPFLMRRSFMSLRSKSCM